MAPPPQQPRRPVDLSADDPLAGLARWVADGLVDAAALARARERWLEQQASEHATVAGVVAELAERGRPIVVTTRDGGRPRGRVVLVGADFVVLRDDGVGDVVIPFAGLATVRAAPGDHAVVGDTVVPVELVLGEALAALAATRPRVLVHVAGGEVRGELRSVGFDVVAVVTDSADRATVHIALATVDRVVVPG